MPQGITDLDRMPAQALLKMHAHAVAIRDLVAQYACSGPLRARADLLIEDIEAAKSYPQPPTAEQPPVKAPLRGSAAAFIETLATLREIRANVVRSQSWPDADQVRATVKVPPGYLDVKHDDGTVHAIDPVAITPDVQAARTVPVCGTATGISSDEAAVHVFAQGAELTCGDCIAILA